MSYTAIEQQYESSILKVVDFLFSVSSLILLCAMHSQYKWHAIHFGTFNAIRTVLFIYSHICYYTSYVGVTRIDNSKLTEQTTEENNYDKNPLHALAVRQNTAKVRNSISYT